MSDQSCKNELATTKAPTETTTETKALKRERPRFQTRASEGGLELSILLPGVPKESLNVEIEDRTLTVTGERSAIDYQSYGDQADEAREYQLRVNVHEDLDTSDIAAAHQNGVLTLKLKKRPEIAKRRIDILAN